MQKSRKIRLGVVGVDSGQLLITDPSYLQGEFQHRKEKNVSRHPVHQHTDGTLWQFINRKLRQKTVRKDVKAFTGKYDEVIPKYGKSPNQMVDDGDLKPVNIAFSDIPDGEFSYDGIRKINLTGSGFGGQLNYKLGHAGAGVTFESGFGDGEYEVTGKVVDFGDDGGERLVSVTVHLITSEDLRQFQQLRRGG